MYTYRCMIPGHDLLGMTGTLTVQYRKGASCIGTSPFMAT